jgi:hypothetical protein
MTEIESRQVRRARERSEASPPSIKATILEGTAFRGAPNGRRTTRSSCGRARSTLPVQRRAKRKDPKLKQLAGTLRKDRDLVPRRRRRCPPATAPRR